LERTKLVTELVSKSSREISADKISVNDIVTTKENLSDPDVQLKMFRSFFATRVVSDDVWESLQKLVRDLTKAVTKDDEYARGARWSVKKLEFDNTFIYDEGNSINFDALPGITGIFGRNARGKSSIVGSLMYTLFNATDRGSVKNLHVINTRKPHCLSKVIVRIDNDDIRIERQSVRHRLNHESG
jgi:hypothetical protein